MRRRRFILCLCVLLFFALPSACMETAGLVAPESNWVAYPFFTFIIPVFLFMQAVPTVTALFVARFVSRQRLRPRRARGFWRMRNFVSCVCVLATLVVTTEALRLFTRHTGITRHEVMFALLFGVGAAWVYGNVAALLCLMAELHHGRDVEPTPPATTSRMRSARRTHAANRGPTSEHGQTDDTEAPPPAQSP